MNYTSGGIMPKRVLPRGVKSYVGWEGAKRKKISGAYTAYATDQKGPNAPVVVVKRKGRERIIMAPSGRVLKRVKILDNRWAYEGRIKPKIIMKKKFFVLD